MSKILIMLLMSLGLFADDPWKRSFVLMSTTATTDVVSSVGGYELNPLNQTSSNKFHLTKGVCLKAAVIGSTAIIQHLLLRNDNNHQSVVNKKKFFTKINTTVAVVWGGATIWNITR